MAAKKKYVRCKFCDSDFYASKNIKMSYSKIIRKFKWLNDATREQELKAAEWWCPACNSFNRGMEFNSD